MARQMAHRMDTRRLWPRDPWLSRLLILCRMRWSKTEGMRWEILPSNAWWYSSTIWQWRDRKMGSCMKISDSSPRVVCYPMEMKAVLLLSLISLHDMPNLEDYSDMEIEANAHTPIHCSHHIHFPRGYDSRRIMDRISREAMGRMDNDEMKEIEKWQTFPLYNFLR